jgi:ribulose-phosphate 3-epimerase
MNTVIAPSILSADFSCLGEQIAACDLPNVDRIHVDVMDGHFVPNLSMGPIVCKAVRKSTKRTVEVHLMVAEPGRFLGSFAAHGADTLIPHIEVATDPAALIHEIRSLGKKAGLAINPGTPVSRLTPFLALIDIVTLMTVWPGFGGQAYLPESCARIRELRALIEQHHPACDLEVDGGIDEQTIGMAYAAGANVFVAGTAVFGHQSGPASGCDRLSRAIQQIR